MFQFASPGLTWQLFITPWFGWFTYVTRATAATCQGVRHD